jgi:hypothetical protein
VTDRCTVTTNSPSSTDNLIACPHFSYFLSPYAQVRGHHKVTTLYITATDFKEVCSRHLAGGQYVVSGLSTVVILKHNNVKC